MKRRLSLVVLVAMLAVVCFGALAACKKTDLDDFSLGLLKDQMSAQFSKVTGASYTLDTSVKFLDEKGKEVTRKVQWTVDNASIVIGAENDGKVQIAVPATVTGSYILKGVLLDEDGNALKLSSGAVVEVQKSFVITTLPNQGGNDDNQGGNTGDNTGGNQGGNTGDNTGGNQGGNTGGTTPEVSMLDKFKSSAVLEPQAGVNYVLAMYFKGASEKILYAIDEMDKNFIKTIDNAASAATVTVETATGGFYLKIGSNYVKMTDNTTVAKTPKAKIELVTASSDASVFKMGQFNSLVTSVYSSVAGGNNEFYFGSYGTFETFSATSTFYYSDTKSGDVDVTQWVGRLLPAGTTIGGTGTGGNTGDTGNTGTGGDNTGGNQGGGTTTTPEGTSVTIDCSGKGAAGAGVAATTITVNEFITATCAQNSGANDPKYYADDLRLYYNNTITFNATGKTITAIVFKFTATNNGTISMGSSAVTSEVAITVNAASASFSIAGGASGKTNGQIRISSITVYFE